MKITVVTLFPNMLEPFFSESIIKRAKEKGLVEIEIVNLRDFAIDSYGTVDEKPYGGGVGMVLKVEPITKALQKIGDLENRKLVLMSAKGKQFNQRKATEYSKIKHLVLLAAHYEGVDERAVEMTDEEICIGDFVMTGGEIAVAAIVDAVVRLIPNVLKQEEATAIESFFEVDLKQLLSIVGENEALEKLKAKNIEKVKLLEFPHYTRPEEFDGKRVPNVLLSGNHAEIEKWRLSKAFEETLKKRPDLLDVV